MGFERDDSGNWKTGIEFRGKQIEIKIDGTYANDTLGGLLNSMLAFLEQRWSDIDASIIEGLYDTYNEDWADPAAGFMPLSESDFLSKINLRSVSLLEGDGLDLFFGDSELFGGHHVNVYVNEDRRVYPAELYG